MNPKNNKKTVKMAISTYNQYYFNYTSIITFKCKWTKWLKNNMVSVWIKNKNKNKNNKMQGLLPKRDSLHI